MIAATGIEPGPARGTRIPAIQILPDRQLISAHAAQHARLIPLRSRPHGGRMIGQRVMTFAARKVFSAAFHPDRNHIPRRLVMRAARLRIQFHAKNLRPSHMKYHLMKRKPSMKNVSVDWWSVIIAAVATVLVLTGALPHIPW
jgi:hypothetical protein